GEAALDLQGFGVVTVVAQEKAERGAGFDGGDDAVLGGVAQKIEAFLLGPADAEHTDHEAKEAWEAGDGELLDSDGHVGVGVLGIDLEHGLAVTARLQSLA